MVTKQQEIPLPHGDYVVEGTLQHHASSEIQESLLASGNGSSFYGTGVGLVLSEDQYASPVAVFMKFVTKVRATHPLQLAWIFLLIILVTSGNAMQIIGLNFWLRYFPKDGAPGNFTTLAVSALLFGIFFLVMLVVYIVARRPSLTFALSVRGWWLIFLIGLMDAVNSSMAIYAASYTPEVLQALFMSVVPVYAAGFTKWILKDPRKYINGWVITSFALIISGVVAASAYQFARGFKEDGGDKAWWSVIFFFSVPPTVLMNIWQSLYMIEFTHDPLFEAPHLLHRHHNHEGVLETPESGGGHERSFDMNSSGALSSQPNETNETPCEGVGEDHVSDVPSSSGILRMQGTDTIVKLVMLAGGTNIQFLLIMLTLPMDALPWWGGSNSVGGAWENFTEGIWCIFHCDKNYLFCMVYTTGFVFTYIGSAYLNQYSVTLCSMIGQLSSPITALLLIIVPQWDLEKGYTPWYMSALAVVLLAIGSLIYALWEEKTDDEKRCGEHKLKEELMANMCRRAPNIQRLNSSTHVGQ
ncbi:hypothetical protein DQ04_00041040 [Trypanosoma grayi]|uniref:hypothetical protein n=1 Tax=Trypanosoma grayi TaxID=71804 RepID=UPI0004F4707E|nr:hypothetical protein DQ04_00041040 [Trypanosoma grayi]KEG15540.1 hypothetical protein DQ04_00041040 [Trypanosoma grayi]